MEALRKIKIALKAARVNKGYSQKNAAIHLGVSQETPSSWKNGRTQPDAEKIRILEEL
ncbi:MAG: helix-turn-helix transcriptional regulator [Bacillota bacterium]